MFQFIHSCVSYSQETRWNLIQEAQRSGLYPCVDSLVDDSKTTNNMIFPSTLPSSASDLWKQVCFEFHESDWEGYVVKRNKHGKSFKNEHTKKRMAYDMVSWGFRFLMRQSSSQEQNSVPQSFEQEYNQSNNRYTQNQTSFPNNNTVESLVLNDEQHLKSMDDGKTHMEAPQSHPELTLESTFDSLSISSSNQALTHSSLTSTEKTSSDSPLITTHIKQGKPSRKLQRLAAIPFDLICPHCSKQLHSGRAYTQHVHMVHRLQLFGSDWSPAKEALIQCDEPGCEKKKFKTENALWMHKVNKHSVIRVGEVPGTLESLMKERLLGLNAGIVDAIDGKDSLQDDNEDIEKALIQKEKDLIRGTFVTDNSIGENYKNAIISQEASGDYDYVPCHVCGQSVSRKPFGMIMHLESLKPAVGLDMRCPLCPHTFIETRALFQHFKFCRITHGGKSKQ